MPGIMADDMTEDGRFVKRRSSVFAVLRDGSVRVGSVTCWVRPESAIRSKSLVCCSGFL